MSYLSPEFAFACLLFLPLYYALGARNSTWQKAALLGFSYFVYATFSWHFVALVFAYSVALGLIVRQIQAAVNTENAGQRKAWLAVGLALALGYLGFFKYYNFFRESFEPLFLALGFKAFLPALDIVLPLGVSFYIFQSITVLFAASDGARRAPVAWLDLLLFQCFLPTLFAGPICRAADLLAQLENPAPKVPLQFDKVLILITLALFKKLVLAAWLASNWVDPVFAQPSQYEGWDVIAASVAYSLQIYFDFSAYTDLVTALALMLGFTLPVNFNQPYLALNIKAFWQRWHMSLSSFIRDYVYVRFGGNRGGVVRTQINLLLAMLLSGLWHGADSKYLVWGLMHGAALVAYNFLPQRLKDATPNGLAIVFTFIWVTIAWVFFRADSWAASLAILSAMTHLGGAVSLQAFVLFALLAVFYWASLRSQAWLTRLENWLASAALWCKVLLAIVAIVVCIELGPSGVPGFIYYSF